MATLIIDQKVKDVQTWKRGYDKNAPIREAHKLSALGVFQEIGNPNRVCVIQTGSPKNLNAFVKDPKLASAMAEAGVIGKPDFHVLDAITVTH